MQAINASSTVCCSQGLPPISITPNKIRTPIMTKPQKIKMIETLKKVGLLSLANSCRAISLFSSRRSSSSGDISIIEAYAPFFVSVRTPPTPRSFSNR